MFTLSFTLSPSLLHNAILGITLLEVAIISFLIIYYLARPGDKKRLWYLILLVFIVLNNLSDIFFPDSSLTIPLSVQAATSFFIKVIVSLYFGYYFYKAFDLKDFKIFNNYGSVFLIVLPYLLIFAIPILRASSYLANKDFSHAVPLVYRGGLIYSVAIGLKNRSYEVTGSDPEDYYVIVSVFISLVCWALLPMVIFFGDFEPHIQLTTNACFLVATFIYIRTSIINTKKEYSALLSSEQNLTKKVEERTIELAQMYEARANTFVNLAHEMRTPLTLINNHLDNIVAKRGMSQDMKVLKYNFQRLTTDVINFFDTERYNKGFTVYDHNKVTDFSELLRNKIVLFREWAQKKRIEIEDSIEDALFTKVHPSAIDRIVNNIIENAIKHSLKNQVVQISLFQKDGRIHFAVSNKGENIPKNLTEKVFEPYFQIESPNNDGMGLGLSIVKKIVEDVKGHIAIESDDSETRFIVTLPFYEGPQDVPAEIPNTSISFEVDYPIKDAIGYAGRPNVLLVEDNAGMVHFLVKNLADRYNIYVATDGEAALKKIEGIANLDLIISDVMMKGMDGIEFCRKVLGDKEYEHVPFIFLSAKTDVADKLTGLKLGAIDYIEKPFSIATVILKIESILELLKKQRDKIEKLLKTESPGNPDDPKFIANCQKYGISKRELDVLKLIIAGKKEKEMADILFVAEGTISSHKREIYRKAGVKKAIELVMKLFS